MHLVNHFEYYCIIIILKKNLKNLVYLVLTKLFSTNQNQWISLQENVVLDTAVMRALAANWTKLAFLTNFCPAQK